MVPPFLILRQCMRGCFDNWGLTIKNRKFLSQRTHLSIMQYTTVQIFLENNLIFLNLQSIEFLFLGQKFFFFKCSKKRYNHFKNRKIINDKIHGFRQ